jgi:hypothetical protein
LEITFIIGGLLFLHANYNILLQQDMLHSYKVLYKPLNTTKTHSLNHIMYLHMQKLIYGILYIYAGESGVVQAVLLLLLHVVVRLIFNDS